MPKRKNNDKLELIIMIIIMKLLIIMEKIKIYFMDA